ncbi:hypothetical protein [Actinomycetospora termitidis]|uniref:Uncharacterized protein n=1 Tax=Actinomycetospora termitidis TaxID=3053470 RepID=A0ABT7M7H8_9PSEU|nr:hypothetical protein [Actinomycetospora sp. Odt1-22]MDL5156622.1 hypothetical protein [Actinomycetospora sp. Odt1-22]
MTVTARPVPARGQSSLETPTTRIPLAGTVVVRHPAPPVRVPHPSFPPFPAPPVPIPAQPSGYGYPPPGAYPVPPLQAPFSPAGSGAAGVPWGPLSGPLPVAPSAAGPARRRGATAVVLTAVLLFVLLVGGGIVAYLGTVGLV